MVDKVSGSKHMQFWFRIPKSSFEILKVILFMIYVTNFWSFINKN